MAIDPQALVDPLAQVSSEAKIGPGVEIGPFSVIEPGASIGAGCKLAARVTIKSGVTLGRDNLVEENAVLGGMPQHLVRPESPGPVVIGDRNVIRENATVHRAMTAKGVTRIGSDCLLMVGAHVAHDCVVADRVVLTNNVLLAGHVTVGERAYLGGGAAVHQFCQVGRLSMIGGMARVPQDVPPFTMIDGTSGLVVGLNKVGLRRAGFDVDAVRSLKDAYRVIFRSGLSLDERLAELDARFPIGAPSEFAPFLRASTRGFTQERRTPPGATIRVLRDADEPAAERRKAG